MGLTIFTLEYTVKETVVKKRKAVVYANNELEAVCLVKKKQPNFWTHLDTEQTPDRGFLTQGRSYKARVRVEKDEYVS